jgi:hypothetical protein
MQEVLYSKPFSPIRQMPLRISDAASTLLIRRQAFESAGLVRADIDRLLGLTDEEFRVEGDVVAIGPVFDGEALSDLLAELEKSGLVFFEDFFELSGNWPNWLTLYAMARAGDK